MTKSQITAAFLMIFIFMSLNSFGAETVKWRHMTSVYTDSKGDSIRLPEGVACNDKSVVVIADTGNNRLLKYTYKDWTLTGGEEIKVPELPYPLKVQMNSAGEIFVLDGKLRRIVRLSPDGAFESYIDPEGLPSVSPVVPKSFRIDAADNIYILDIFSNRILVLDQHGKYLKQLELPKDQGFISDFAIGTTGNVYLLDSVNAMVYSAAPDSSSFSPLTKSLKEHMNFPANLTVDRFGNIYIADQNGGVISILGQDGSFKGHQSAFGWKEAQFRYPSQMCITENEDFFIADRENSRIQIFSVSK